MVASASAQGVEVYGLSGFYYEPMRESFTVVAGYGGLDEYALQKAAESLLRAWG